MHPHQRNLLFRFLIIVGFAIQSLISVAQVSRPQQNSRAFGSDPIIVDPRTNKSMTVAAIRAQKDTTVQDSIVHFIVRLRTSPNARNNSGRIAQGSQINQEHDEFLAKLNQLSGSARTSSESKTIDVVREYKRAFNGFTIKANRSLLGAIRKMPHVIAITEDKKVKANDETTNAVINVPNAWTAGATGQGIVIGIIDTGIDYSHPDLGGGIGAGYKVIGGYDFINNDDDPKDDHGHGTHCAGIAAANGLIKGVAPNAKLMAIKVLDSYGSGTDSQVLAGIEYATDPDGNPATDDAPDVCSMSLGRPADPNEPMSEAVNNAVAQGIVFVIAAGNSYDYMTIGTPGIAEDAITVAAIDNSGVTASFSSKGPVQDSFVLKPDLAAPGVDVGSTFLNSGYAQLSGTSMATPHVAGTAALILSKNPDWSPADVKGALMSTAHYDGDQKFLETGAGIVDAYAAATTNIIMSPGSISYGQPDKSKVFHRNDVITVSNRGTSSQSISLEVEGMDGGIGVQLTPSSFTLNAGQTREVKVEVNVDMTSLPIRVFPNGYYGTVVLTAGSQKLKTILSLFNPLISTINFGTDIPNLVIASGPNNYFNPFVPTSATYKALFPLGTYDLFAWYNNGGLVIVEDFEVTEENAEATMLASSAKNLIDFNPVDRNGLSLPVGGMGLTELYGPKLFSLTLGPLDTYLVSDTRKYKLVWRAFIESPDQTDLYEIAFKCDDLTSSQVLTNDPEDFTPITITNPTLSDGVTEQGFFYYGQAAGWTVWNTFPVQIPSPANIYTSIVSQDQFASFFKFLPAGQSSGFAWETSRISNGPGTGLEYVSINDEPIASIEENPFDFQLGKSLLNFTPYMLNGSEHIQLLRSRSYGAYNYHYGERISGLVNWSLKNNGQIHSSGNFKNEMFDDFLTNLMLDIDVPSGQKELTLTWDSYYVGGRFSNVTTKLDFTTDIDVGDGIPPQLMPTKLTSNGHVTNAFKVGDGGMIAVSGSDLSTVQMSVEMKKFDTDTWQAMSLTNNDGIYSGEISTNTLAGLYSLRIKALDASGNSTTHTLDPAFSVGDQPVVVPFTSVALITPIDHDVNAGVHPEFTWSEIPGATYTFQLSSTDSFQDLLIDRDGLTSPSYESASDLEKDETYYWRVQATLSDFELPWSKVFTFIAGKLPSATLLAPANGAVGLSDDPVELRWTPAPGAGWQLVEIATDEDFNLMYSSFGLPPSQGSYLFYNQTPMNAWWRITSVYFFAAEYRIPSEVFSFSMLGDPDQGDPNDPGGPNDPIAGLERAPGIVSYFPNPFTDVALVTFYSSNDEEAKVTLIDGLGRLVRSQPSSLVKGENILSIESEHKDGVLNTGMYVVLIETASGESHRVKLIKK